MIRSDEAVASFSAGFTCSAAVFSAFSRELGLDVETARKIACGFGAGVSRSGNICGAVSGAILVIGLKYGKANAGDDHATEKTRTLVREFLRQFTERHGSVNCTELLGWNLADPGEYEHARDEGLFKTRCPVFVRDAAEILDRIL
ncbi:MAG TPA: C-GCAxxG-C-C family protein [Methanolinea sp.]|nr:C-GCAxxG-C-C family protein [Methanolinea sp.]HQK56124.1 C-GCAxxG-C-C family protein [Methanolinea sp.]